MLELIFVVVAVLCAVAIFFFWRKSKQNEESKSDYDQPLPEPKKLKTGVWDRLETNIAAFLAVYSEEYYFDKDISKYAQALNRSEGALHAKVRRLRTLEGIPQETSELGESVYAYVKTLQPLQAYNYFLDNLSQSAYKVGELYLSEEFRLEEYKTR